MESLKTMKKINIRTEDCRLKIYAIIQIHLSMIVLQTGLYRTARSRVNTSIILK